jgi:hypothetical protein
VIDSGNATGTVQIPLASGLQSFGPAGTESPFGPVTGTSFLAPDGSFFYADLTPVDLPSQHEFVYGGEPVSQSFYAPTGAARFFAFNVASDRALQSVIPFIRQQTGGLLADPVVSPLLIAAPANGPFAGPTSETSNVAFARSLQASLAINGQGANQSSVLVLMVGNPLSTSTSSQPILQGQIAGSFLASGTSQPVSLSSFVSTPQDGNGVGFYGGNAISGFVLSGTASEQTGGSGPISNYNFEEAATATTLPSGVGASQTLPSTLSGFFGGIMTRETGSPFSYALTGSSSVATDPTNLRVGATFVGFDPFTSESSGIISMTLQFGGLTGGTGLGQAYIDQNLYAALQSPSSFSLVNGNNANTSSIWMLTSDVVPSTALLPAGVSFCQCQYLQWGYWGGGLASFQDGATRIDASHINTWVVGQPTALGDIQSLAGMNVTGSYTGALVGTVSNNGAQYLAAGGFNETYAFARQTLSFQVNNFDGKSFGASNLSVPLSGPNYSFGFSAGGFAGNFNGSFYGPLAAETGGNFAFRSISGAPYLASGIFAAAR